MSHHTVVWCLEDLRKFVPQTTNDERHYVKQKFHVYSLFSETELKIARLHDKAEWNPMIRMFQTQLASESVIIGDDE